MQAKYFASCPRGLEELLEQEAKDWQAKTLFRVKGGLQFDMSDEHFFRFLLNSRVASRMYLKLQHFKIRSLDELYDKNVNYPWEEVLGVNQTFKIQTLFDHQAKKAFRNSMVAGLKLKDALADHFRNKTGQRPDVDTKDADVQLLLRVEGSKKPDLFYATVWLDLVGTPLSHRGYRPPKMRAPLRENLAAGLIMSTDWKPETEFLMDPMCGSGTLLIEAMLIKLGVAPSYLRVGQIIEKQADVFCLQHLLWLLNNPKRVEIFHLACEDVYHQARKAIMKRPAFALEGSDINPQALETAHESMKLALLNSEHIKLFAGSAQSARPPESPEQGILITNPPYGERLGANDDLEGLYYEFGENLKANFKNLRAYVFTGSPELRKQISLKTAERKVFHNGDIECRLLKYELY